MRDQQKVYQVTPACGRGGAGGAVHFVHRRDLVGDLIREWVDRERGKLSDTRDLYNRRRCDVVDLADQFAVDGQVDRERSGQQRRPKEGGGAQLDATGHTPKTLAHLELKQERVQPTVSTELLQLGESLIEVGLTMDEIDVFTMTRTGDTNQQSTPTFHHPRRIRFGEHPSEEALHEKLSLQL